MMAKNRYTGISPYTGENKDVFFGRESDKEELYEQILIKQQVLLYSKSGLGKSSLINAGIIPRFEAEKTFTPIRIRFGAYTDSKSISPLQRIFEELSSHVNEEELTLIDEINGELRNKTLWFLFKKVQLQNPDKKIILVFDQFEELFSYPDAIIKEFKIQLSEILNGEVPEYFVEYFAKARSKNREKYNRSIMRLLSQNVTIKTIYIIRSDRLSLLNTLRDRIPNIQKSFYELLPLTEQQAREAITKPAQKLGDYKTDVFQYEEKALNKIINFLTNEGKQSVETTQLQIICQRIEEGIFEENQKKSKELKNKIITTNDLPDFKDIFFNFYNDAINEVEEKQREKARILVENESIRNKQRISLDQNICKEYITESELNKLVNKRLLRSEKNTFGRYSYELSHDTLVEPIHEAAEIRKTKEKKLRLELEHQKERQIAEEKQKRQRKIIFMVASIAFVALLAMVISGFLYFETKEAKQEAEKQTRIAKESLQKIKNALLKEASLYIEAGEYQLAKSKYIYIKENLPGADTSKAVLKRILLCDQLINERQHFDNLMFEGENAFSSKKYGKAYEKYSEALNSEIKTGKKETILKLQELKSVIDLKIKGLESDLEFLNNEKDKRVWKQQITELKEISNNISTKIKR